MPGPQTPFLDLSVLAQISGAPIVDDRGGVLGGIASPGAEALTERLRTITALDIGAPDLLQAVES